MEENNQAVPKFSSFKPKPKPEPEPESKSKSVSRSEPRTRNESLKGGKPARHASFRSSDSHRAHRRDHSEIRHGEHRRHRLDREHRDRDRDREHKPAYPAHPDRSREDESSLWKIDPTGDKYNVAYGSLHKYDVPQFRRIGHGRVLGLPTNMRIDRDAEADEKTIAIRSSFDTVAGKDRDLRKDERDAAWRRARKVTKTYRVVRDARSDKPDDLGLDFLSVYDFPASKKRRHVDDEDLDDEPPYPSEVNYRSIEGKAKPAEAADYGLETSEEGADGREEAARRENAKLFKLVEERPNDVDAWVKCIDFQETLFGTLDAYGHRILTAADKRALVDIRMSLYEKALSTVSTAVTKDRLVLSMLEEGAGLWDTKTLSKKWVQVLQSYPYSMILWVKYLNFQQTHFLNFSYSRLENFFNECLRLNDSSLAKAPDDAGRHHVQVIHIYLLLRMTLFMRESGYIELATGIWQALLEFNLFRPKNVISTGNRADAIASFRSWWESEAPRIGEVGAQNWDKPAASRPEKNDDDPPLPIKPEAPFSSWECAEQHQMQRSFVPARALDQVSDDDPYRVVLFSDIAGYLSDFSQPDLMDLLLDAFLIFCRLPPIKASVHANVVSEWQSDPLVCNDLLDTHHYCTSRWFSHPEEDDQSSSTISPCEIPFLNFSLSSDVTFANIAWFSSFRLWKDNYANDSNILNVDWIRRALRHIVVRRPDYSSLAEYSLALDSQYNPAETRLFAKKLLKRQSSNLRLYHAYALVELCNDDWASTERVLESTITISERFAPDEKVYRILLWRTWVWEYFSRSEWNNALQLFLFMVQEAAVDTRLLGNNSPSTPLDLPPTSILKVKQMLFSIQDYGISNGKADISIAATDCMAILSYILNDRGIEEALDTYRATASKMRQQKSVGGYSASLELLYQAKAKLLYHHAMTSRLYSPTQLRAELADAIESFPSNTIFLSLFAWNEARFRTEDRVRAVVKKYSNSSTNRGNQENGSSLITHLFSIYTELHRGVSAGSTAYSVRSAFESALSGTGAGTEHRGKPPSATNSSCSALVWKLYILFELSQPEPRRARDVFYRAIQSCPWAKELVLLSLRDEKLRSLIMTRGSEQAGDVVETAGIGWFELAKIWNVVSEREFRTHVDLETWFEQNGIDLMKQPTDVDDGLIKLPKDEDGDGADDDDDAAMDARI